MKDYIAYVERQLQYFEDNSTLIDKHQNEITPALINENLANYSQVNVGLDGEYQRKRIEVDEFCRRFQAWWDERYVAKRRELNPHSLSGSKWLSKSEIESEVRVAYPEEYGEWRNRLDELQAQLDFIDRLLSQWKEHGRKLETLSQNMRQEMVSLGIENRVNRTPPHRAHSFPNTVSSNGDGAPRRRKAQPSFSKETET